MAKQSGTGGGGGGGVLGIIERIGNALPDPAILFVIGAAIVVLLSAVASWSGWSVLPQRLEPVTEMVMVDGEEVRRPVLDEAGEQLVRLVPNPSFNDGQPIEAFNLLTSDGIYWMFESMVANFVGFAPLGIVLTGMLGIGVAERTGLIGAVLKAFMLFAPRRLLTPIMVFLGIMSSLGLDAGYIVLPPLAAALYKSVGRSPLAGIAAVFCGVSAGFNANLFITGLDPMLASFSEIGAKVIEPEYVVAATCNWYFMIASTVVITLAGWATSAWIVEKRFARKSPEEGGPVTPTAEDLATQRLEPAEWRAMAWAFAAFAVAIALMLAAIGIPDWPLHGLDRQGAFPRWVRVIVPLIFLTFLIPGVVYGVVMGNVRSSKDLARLFTESMAYMAPIIVLAFFAAQFIEYFKKSQLDQMLAHAGGAWLAELQMPAAALIVSFVLVTMLFNLFIGSMSAKYAMFAPIFVPMLMLAAGISPELTQAAYRIGDSTTNIITPLNAYLVIILVVMQKFAPKAGMGTLIAMMLPYTVVFTVVWIILLLMWMALGIPLGPEGPLVYRPS
jgi:aminobenzoyl-glutamate transport protein